MVYDNLCGVAPVRQLFDPNPIHTSENIAFYTYPYKRYVDCTHVQHIYIYIWLIVIMGYICHETYMLHYYVQNILHHMSLKNAFKQ